MTIPEVIGIDPSLKATGFCGSDGTTFTLTTGDAKRGDTRLHDLRKMLRYYLRANPARLAVVEVPARFQSGDAALAAGMAQGIVREILVEFAIPFGKLNPTLVKKFATGRGDADKGAMVAAANRHRLAAHTSKAVGDRMYDDLTDDNQADAWWLRQMGLWHLGVKTLDPGQDEVVGSNAIRDTVIRPAKGAKWPGR
jgi:crossover junction endodeoxyribonuclease RuvC